MEVLKNMPNGGGLLTSNHGKDLHEEIAEDWSNLPSVDYA